MSIRDSRLRAISRMSLIEGLAPDDVEQVFTSLLWREVRRDELVLSKGTPGEHLLFLVQGRLKVVDVTTSGREIGLNLLNTGDHFGELAIIDGGTRSASVVAMETCIIALMPRDKAWEMFYRHPLVAQRMLTDLAGRLRKASRYQTILCLPNAHQRVFAMVELLSRTFAGGAVVVEHLPKQHELAMMANTSRETISRALQSLLQDGVVEKDGRRLIIRRPAILHQWAQRDEPHP
jgi:CRP-like cAMP-binding protein